MTPSLRPEIDPQALSPATHRVGVISDTHGLLRPETIAALAGVDQIIHAGDVGAPEILTALSEIEGSKVSYELVELATR